MTQHLPRAHLLVSHSDVTAYFWSETLSTLTSSCILETNYNWRLELQSITGAFQRVFNENKIGSKNDIKIKSESALFAKCAQTHKEFVVVKKLLVHAYMHTYVMRTETFK